MQKYYVNKVTLTREENPAGDGGENDDDLLLEDPNDDLICSLASQTVPQAAVELLHVQPQHCFLPPQPAKQPINRVPVPPKINPNLTDRANPVNQQRGLADSKYDQLVGEICMLKERLDSLTQQLKEERESKQKLRDEKESAMNELKENYEKKLNNMQAKLDFKEHDYARLKIKISELEKQLKSLKNQIDFQNLDKPLPYSLPIVMHRVLDFNNHGFVDWDDSVTYDDISG